MGAIVGSLYASGYSADELEEITLGLDWADIFDDSTARSRETFRRKSDDFGFLTDYKVTFRDGKIVLPKGLIQGQNLFLELSRLLATTRSIGKFEDLPIPFRLVATDLETGKPVVMTDGDLATAVFGSMAIPGLIPPVEREGHLLLDGGLVNNVPVDLARQLGADIVIVVNVGTEAKPASEISNFVDVLRQTQILLTQSNIDFQLSTMASDDILVLPDFEGLGATSFDETATLIERGEMATNLRIENLKQLALDDRKWTQHLLGRLSVPQITPVIDQVQIAQDSNLSDDFLSARLSIRPGERFDADQINRDIDTLYGEGLFSRITYRIVEIDDQTILKVSAKTKESSDGYFRFGVSLDSNLENESSFKLGVSYTKPQINRWGGEWRSEVVIGDTLSGITELYQPLGNKQKVFIEPSLILDRNKVDFFDENDTRRGELKSLLYGASLQGGVLFGRWGELRGGVTRVEGDIDFTADELKENSTNISDASLSAQFSIDTLDSLAFPTDGELLIARYEFHDTFFGGENEFEAFDIQTYIPRSFGRHTIAAGAQLTGSSGDDADILGTSQLGGFLSLSGFSEDELSGQYSALLFGTYYYRLNQQATLFDAPIYLGGSVEVGNVYQDFDDIGFGDAVYAGSVFAGLKSPIGPVFVGIGTNDEGKTSLYFSIGSFF
jgi:NTE family protein